MICLLMVIFASQWSESVSARNVLSGITNRCGVVSNQFSDIPAAIANATEYGMSYWWNWAKSPPNGFGWTYDSQIQHFNSGADTSHFSQFIPMMWGPHELSADQIEHLQSGYYVMGFNEPDLYGPPRCGMQGGGTSHSDYRPATSCGAWENCFHPGQGAENWRVFIDQIFPNYDFDDGPRIMSPAMALNPTGDASECETNSAVSMKLCPGWLLTFKQYTKAMPIITSTGEITNYWDIIDIIQFHAYDYEADSVINKIDLYKAAFLEDIENGMTMWLTEIAGAYLSFDDQADFMRSVLPRLNDYGPELESYSWFSVWSFPSFEIHDRQPTTVNWVSNLFKIDGSLNKLGKLYFELCTAE